MFVFIFALLLIFIVSLFFLTSSLVWGLSVDFLSFGHWFWYIMFQFDNVSFIISLMLSICYMYVYFYVYHYFGEVNSCSKTLSSMICVFVSVMLILIYSGDYLFTLIFWEFLGVVSFFLILFYGNYLGLRSSIITLVSSRFGDVCLFILIAFNGLMIGNELLGLMLFFFIVFTKSAGFPFISWLLEAMRAPTPVSSLVHSSTLVAAGVWFMLRYDCLVYIAGWKIITMFLLLTILITGVSSFFFFDLKKIVALSTCNNISWCIFYLIFGDSTLCLLQLVSHGVSKCLLFMLVGDVMSGSGGSQASNCVYSPRLYGESGIFSLLSVILGLSGVPFIGVFFTKHFLLSSFSNFLNVSVLITLYVCVFLSYLYSFRLCYMLISIKSSVSVGILYVFGAGVIIYFWLFVNFFMFLVMDENVSLSINSSLVLIIFQLVSFFISLAFYDSGCLSLMSSNLFGCDNLVEWFYKIALLAINNVYLFLYRWDKLSVSLFNNIGVTFISSYTVNNTNIILFSFFLLLSMFAILY